MALILVASQSASERQRLRQILEIQEHVVVEADTSLYCIEIAECHQPECILLNPVFSEAPLDHGQLLQSIKTLRIPTILMAEPDQHEQYRMDGIAVVLDEMPDAGVLSRHLGTILQAEPALVEEALVENTILPSFDRETVATTEPSMPARPLTPSPTTPAKREGETLLDIERLQMLMGLGVQEASETLMELTDCPINFQVPVIETMTAKQLQAVLEKRFGDTPICAAQLGFTGEMAGAAQLFFPQDSAIALVEALTAEDPDSEDFAELKQEALTEVGNIVLNSIMGAISNEMTHNLTYSVPTYQEGPIESLTRSLATEIEAEVLLAKARFLIESLGVAGEILLFFKLRLFFDLTPK